MFHLFYKSWIWYRLGVIIVFIYVRLAFSFFYLLTLLICVRFSSTAPCTSAWAPHFCSLGPKRKTREIPKGGIFFSFFFNFSFFNITIHKDWHFFHSTPETLTVTKTKKTPLHSFSFTRDGAYRGGGGWGSKHQQHSEGREAPRSLQQGAYTRITHILT